MQIVPGYVIGSTLLHFMSINKVKLELKGVKQNVEVIAIPESMRIKGDTAWFCCVLFRKRKKIEILIVSTLNKNITLKPGTQIGLFQICEHPIKILYDNGIHSKTKGSFVGPVQSDTEDLEWKFWNHLKSAYQNNLQKELMNLLVKHKDAIALPGDALGKTNVLKHKIN